MNKKGVLEELKKIRVGVRSMWYNSYGHLTPEAEACDFILGLTMEYLEQGEKRKLEHLLGEVRQHYSSTEMEWLIPLVKSAASVT